ncbi:MAG: DNA polymerase III subunit gamma/tau [Lachnospiraceae bacterium]|nr:DNA polymerase III subunit gamma/tau [Lachnospiraceae bacterium]
MGYTALYRKFRPDTFADVKGQDHIVTALKNQIKADRIGHAYLFCGTRGTGKTSVAKIFARAVNCEHPVDGNPCNECAACRAIASGSSMNVIEIDAASNNGVDNIREIREEVSYSPAEGKYKVYIIDEVHMLSIGAFNALLKTLEEPPSYVIFILATTEAHKIPVTILSRCQRYDFRRISQDTILERLKDLMEKEHVDAEERALRYVAKKGDGSLRDALSLLDQCIAFYLGETLTYDKVLEVLGAVDTDVYSDLLRKILRENVAEVISTLEKLVMRGTDLTQFVSDFTWYLRNLMLLKASDEMEDVLDVSTENLAQLREEAAMVREDTLMRYIRIFSELSGSIRYATNKRVLLEMALIKLCKPEAERDELSLLERIRKLEQKLEQGCLPGAGGYPGNGYRGGTPDGSDGNGAPGGGYGYEGEIPGGSYGYGGESPAGSYGYGGGAPDSSYGCGGGIPDGGYGHGGGTPNGGYGGPAPVYQKAAPEDLQQVKAMWKAIVGETSGMFRIVLSAAEPKFNPQDDKDGKLYVVFADFLAERYLDNKDRKQELEQIITEKTGKQIEVKFVLAADEGIQRAPLARIDVEQRAREVIHTEIEIEDED